MSLLDPIRPLLVRAARSRVLIELPHIVQTGTMILKEGDDEYSFGNSPGETVTITVFNDYFWLRLVGETSLAVSEAYMEGEIAIDSLPALMKLYLDNQCSPSSLSSSLGALLAFTSGFITDYFGQSKTRAVENSAVSYDPSNALFEAFLSKEMMYSCALWSEEEGGANGDLARPPIPGSLEDAQLRKLQLIIKRARITKNDVVLEVGTGWGAFAIEAVHSTGCTVHSITLSAPQKELAEARIAAAGLQDSIKVYLMDYRDIPNEWDGKFDVFMSKEMIEHVGIGNLPTYFAMVNRVLKPRGARAVITSSTCPEPRYAKIQPLDFARKYLWPNATIPSITALINAANEGSARQLILDSTMNYGPHYGRTLREWGRRYDANLNGPLLDRLIQDQPALADPKALERFHRKWRFFFQYAAAGYACGYVNCHMMTFVRQDVTAIGI